MSKSDDPIYLSPIPRSAADRKKKLGKGLGALMGETRREEPLVAGGGPKGTATAVSRETSSTDGLSSIPVASIEPLPGQPRTHFDDDALAELAASISQRGVIQPIIVRPIAGGRYQLVAGERRWRASQKARLHEIPAIVRDLDKREIMAIALIENLQRVDLNPIEEARAYRKLADEEGLSQSDIATMVDKSRSHVANLQRLLVLPDEVIDLVEGGKLSMGHARALIGNDDAVALAKSAVSQSLSVREVEQLAKGEGATPTKTGKARPPSRDPVKDADIAAVQRHLEEFLGLSVRIKTDTDPRTGLVTIRYKTLDQLDLICQRLTGGDI